VPDGSVEFSPGTSGISQACDLGLLRSSKSLLSHAVTYIDMLGRMRTVSIKRGLEDPILGGRFGLCCRRARTSLSCWRPLVLRYDRSYIVDSDSSTGALALVRLRYGRHRTARPAWLAEVGASTAERLNGGPVSVRFFSKALSPGFSHGAFAFW